MSTDVQDTRLKVSSKFWARSVGLVLLFVLIFPPIVIFYFGQRYYLLCGFFWLFSIYRLWANIRLARRSYIAYSPTRLSGYLGRDFTLGWDEIKAVQFLVQGENRSFFVFTASSILTINRDTFDENDVRDILQTHLPPIVFEAQAYQNLIDDLDAKNRVEAQFENLPQPLKVTLDTGGVVVGVLCILGSGVVSVFLHAVNRLASAWFLPLALLGLGVLLVISTGRLEAGNEKISMYTRYHQFHFAWRDIREIYRVSMPGGIIALVGENSRFIVPAQSRWAGKDAWQLANFINYKLAESKIEPMNGDRKIYAWRSKNAPVTEEK